MSMNYSQRWHLAVALKQAYPTLSETGDVAPDASAPPAASPPPPPQFTAAELAPAIKAQQWKMTAYGAAGGLVVGGLLGLLIKPKRSRAHA
jgi:hypothetical protein